MNVNIYKGNKMFTRVKKYFAERKNNYVNKNLHNLTPHY